MKDDKKPHGAGKSEAAEREERILAFWKEKNIFEKTLNKPSAEGEFVFYEGPPTANAAPAVHHLEARAFKDVIPRYKTMRGYHVRRKGGWDTHGLPVELQIEKKLGLKSKKEIETYGIAEFNRQCRESVWEYVELWSRFTERIGYWVDGKNPYVTYHNSYIESLWNIVAKVNSRDLLYKDYKVVPWCPRCGTALSSHELAQGYQDVTDISVFVKFKVIGQDNTYLLAWTTTPWTLPGNVGLAVHEAVEYIKIKVGDEFLILAKERLSVTTEQYEIIEEMKGSSLVGLSYEPLYPYLAALDKGDEKLANAYKVYAADFVTTEDGTGIVHTAIMYGQEDFELGTAVGMPKFHLVAPDGTFISGTDFLEGRHVRDEETAVEIIKDLAHRGLLFKKEKYKHSYPHCWRCKTALIYYARDSWYIRMSQLRGQLQKENEKINWEPSHIKEGRFGEWLREAKDWAISRERYWGTPLPVWETQGGAREVISSIDDLKKRVKKSGNTYIAMRHGEAEHNVKNIWGSRAETPYHLTETGRREVEGALKNLRDAHIDIIVASPFVRTRETADIICRGLGLSAENIIFDERLGEWDVGGYDGKSLDEYFKSRRGDDDPYTFESQGAESYRNIVRRAGGCLYDLEKTYAGKKILIISHGAVLRALHFVADGISLENEKTFRAHFNEYAFAESRVVPFVPFPHNEFFELDLHRPYIDDVALVSESGEDMTRVKEVMDVWFDSGAMPFAQDHYPFENRGWVDGAGYPADFISEAVDQTRGWFYTLLCVGVLMERGTPYKNVICLGHILDKEGKKMSKSIGNVLDPWLLMDSYGVDALRLWMYSVNQPGDSKNFDEKTVDEIVKKVFNPLSNIHALFATYDGGVPRSDPYASDAALDRWILSRLSELVSATTKHMDHFQLFEPVRLVRDFVQDFSTWFVRRSRDRFKSDDLQEKSRALSVTEHVLIEMAKVLAPFAPFYAEWLYREITKGARKESVHLEEWPASFGIDEAVLASMKETREIVSQGLELRQKAGIKVRQPLGELKITQTDLPEEYVSLIANEVNVKTVTLSQDAFYLDTTITNELKEEGIVRDIIRAVQDGRKSENLMPSDVVSVVFSASQTMRHIISSNEKSIMSPTGIADISFVPEKQEYELAIDGENISFSIHKK